MIGLRETRLAVVGVFVMTSTDGQKVAEAEMQNRQGNEYWFHDCSYTKSRVTTQKPWPCNSCGVGEADNHMGRATTDAEMVACDFND